MFSNVTYLWKYAYECGFFIIIIHFIFCIVVPRLFCSSAGCVQWMCVAIVIGVFYSLQILFIYTHNLLLEFFFSFKCVFCIFHLKFRMYLYLVHHTNTNGNKYHRAVFCGINGAYQQKQQQRHTAIFSCNSVPLYTKIIYGLVVCWRNAWRHCALHGLCGIGVHCVHTTATSYPLAITLFYALILHFENELNISNHTRTYTCTRIYATKHFRLANKKHLNRNDNCVTASAFDWGVYKVTFIFYHTHTIYSIYFLFDPLNW